MQQPADITATIIEGLYGDALSLAEETRLTLERASRVLADTDDGELARITLSCEALRCTTRMMHALAWLLNHRAFFAGELSAFQLSRHGRLPEPQPRIEPEHACRLPGEVVQLTERTSLFYDRLLRLERQKGDVQGLTRMPVSQLQNRIGAAFLAG